MLPAIVKSFGYAIAGVWYCIRTQRNFRFHMVAALTVLILSRFFRLTAVETVLLAFTILFVMICEMINTAIEAAVDLYCQTYHPMAKIAKDVAAGAVFLSAIIAVAVGIALFWQPDVIGRILHFVAHTPVAWAGIVLYIGLAVWFVGGWVFQNEEKTNGEKF